MHWRWHSYQSKVAGASKRSKIQRRADEYTYSPSIRLHEACQQEKAPRERIITLVYWTSSPSSLKTLPHGRDWETISAAAAAREPTRAIPCSSSSSDDNDDDPDYRVDSSDDVPYYPAATVDDNDNAAADVVLPMAADAEGVVSSLRTQADVDAVCKKYGVPKDQYTARPAGDLRASSPPPPGAVCVYAHALEAGMRIPLHRLFFQALSHYGIAPTQLVPNGWRIMAGFVVLCHYAGVPPSLAVFRHFFLLSNKKKKGSSYLFRSKDSGLRFEGLPNSIKGWKDSFFFLSSPTPWPCPVEWGEPSKSSLMVPVLTGEEKRSVATLLRAHGAAPVDIRTYLRDSSLAAAMISVAAPPPTPPPLPPSRTPASAGSKSKGMYPSVYDMMKNIQAEKAATAQASPSANKVKSEPGSDARGSLPLLCGKKRRLDEADGKAAEGRPPSVVVPTPPSARGRSLPAAEEPSDVASSNFVGILKAANNMISSLEAQLQQAKGEVTAVKAELTASKRAAAAEREKAKVELAAAKRAGEAELEKVKAELAEVKRMAKAERENAGER